MAVIKSIIAHMILDSRGNPTVESIVSLDDGIVTSSAVPSGASTGSHEAHELRDTNDTTWEGKGVQMAINNVNQLISPKLIGMDVTHQAEIDKTMIDLDGTTDKSKLGANAILSVSQAVVKAASVYKAIPIYKYVQSLMINPGELTIPTPLFNVLEGGLHASNGLNFQEFLVIPAVSHTFEEKIRIGVHVYQSLKKLLTEKNQQTFVADEGGFSPGSGNNVDALNLVKQACELSLYKYALDVFLGLDCAATNFFSNEKYHLIDNSSNFNTNEMVDFYNTLIGEFSLVYLEDPMAEDDIAGWELIANRDGAKTLIVGDDLTTTNPYRLQMAVDKNLINAIIIKPNQIGTITESIAVVEMAKYKKYKIVVSHRSGETQDTFIADFAIGVGADYAKLGAPARERAFKYNRLLTAAREMGIK